QWLIEDELALVLFGHLVHALLDVASDDRLLQQPSLDRVLTGQPRTDEIERRGNPDQDEYHPDPLQDIVNPHVAAGSPPRPPPQYVAEGGRSQAPLPPSGAWGLRYGPSRLVRLGLTGTRPSRRAAPGRVAGR